MHQSVQNLKYIEDEINLNKNKLTTLIAVSKTFSIIDIKPLLQYGHIHYGENKVQEAFEKWKDVRNEFKNIKLHLIGNLQTNKVKQAVIIFDYIHSLNSVKLADKISSEQKKINKNLKIFIQINIGNEAQKNGIQIDELDTFYNYTTKKLKLNVVGLMCIPPVYDNPEVSFKLMNTLSKKLQTKELSMGMSSDYQLAIKNGATYIRVGSKIFGKRTY
jgi:PLP dependent protein